MKKKVKAKPIGYWQKKADKVFQKWLISRHPNCELCGKPAQCGHHYFPKSVASALRYDESNMIPICQGHHFRHHNGDPRIHAEVLEIRGMDWHNNLKKKKEQIIKVGIKYYQSIIKKYGSINKMD